MLACYSCSTYAFGMERTPSPEEVHLSPHLRDPEEWQEILKDNDLLHRFNELVNLTQANLDTTVYPWAADRIDVAMRWQHAVELLGNTARSYMHPLFLQKNGGGWLDEVRVKQVLDAVPYRQRGGDEVYLENALILTHSLALQQQDKKRGLVTDLCVLNNIRDMQNPEVLDFFTKRFDLRDFAEPNDTVIGNMTVEEYGHLTEDERNELYNRVHRLAFSDKFGGDYGWASPPQMQRYLDEMDTLYNYSKIVRYGTADNDEIFKIRNERKVLEIAQLRQERPDFGKLPDDFKVLPNELKRLIQSMFMYFDSMRDRFEDLSIDTYSMGEMGYSEEDLDSLKSAGILVDEQTYMSPVGPIWSYKVSKPYYEHWVARFYPPGVEPQEVKQPIV